MKSLGIRRETAALWLMYIMAAALFSYHCVYTSLVTRGVDYGKHWKAAHVLLKGGSPYEGDLYMSFNYPLFTGWLFSWLAGWRWRSARNENALMAFGILALLAFTPLLEINHFVWVLPSFFLLLNCWVKGEIRTGWMAVVVVGGAGTMAMEVFLGLQFGGQLGLAELRPEGVLLAVLLIAAGGAALTAVPRINGDKTPLL